jgi:hypothetical protein
MEDEPVPVQLMIVCFMAAGFIVAIVYSIHWDQLSWRF